ncbi:c-type cytochrome, partial [Variovorax sp. CT11-76]
MRLPSRPLHHGLRATLAALAVATFGLLGLQSARAAEPAGVPDTIEQRVAACIACHGRQGSTGNAAFFPRLAGKPAGYLFNQLRSFRDGRRSNTDMNYMVRHMSDAYLQEIADYFAGLDLPYAAVSPTSDAAPAQLARGRQA